MVGTSGPQGSVTYRADPSQPGGYTQVTQLSPAEQAIYDAQKRTELGATNIANEQLGRVQGALQTPLDTAGLPGLSAGIQRQPIQMSLGGGRSGVIGQMGFGGYQPQQPGGQIQYGVPQTQLATGFNTGPSARTTFDQGPQVQTGFDSAGQVQRSLGASGPIQGSFNQGGALTSNVDVGGPERSFAPQGQIQTSFGAGQPLQYGFDQGQGVQGHVGPVDLNGAALQAQNAVYGQAASRLDPRFSTEEAQLRNRLSNQGLSQNSEAYQNALDDFYRGKNDAYNQAIFSSVGAGNDTAQQLFNQSLAQGQFANQAAGQQYAQNQGQAAFHNAVAGQDYAQQKGLAEFGNLAQQQQFGQSLEAFNARNAAQQQAYGQAMGNAQLNNAAQGQTYQQNLGAAQFGNQAQQQGYDQQLGRFNAENDAQQQQYLQNQGLGQFYNSAQQQQYGQNLGAAQFFNQGAGQQFTQGQGAAQFYNDAQQQRFGQGVTNVGLNNAAQQQAFGQNLAAGDQRFSQMLQAAQYGLGAQSQDVQQQLALAQLQNQARQQGLNERAYIANTPINQLTGLLSLGQVGMPQGINYTPTQVANTDVIGANALSAQAQQANYNARLQQQSGMMNGLFSLGSAAIMASDGRLKTDKRLLRTRPDGVEVWAFRYLTDPEGMVRIGVMAQQAKKHRPDLVVKRGDGFLAFNYAGLEAA